MATVPTTSLVSCLLKLTTKYSGELTVDPMTISTNKLGYATRNFGCVFFTLASARAFTDLGSSQSDGRRYSDVSWLFSAKITLHQ